MYEFSHDLVLLIMSYGNKFLQVVYTFYLKVPFAWEFSPCKLVCNCVIIKKKHPDIAER